ncbi:MAG: phage portal protein [Rhodocyclaceae bacterium]|nr:phage portal protein [Rhodocyclaceae bacterium]
MNLRAIWPFGRKSGDGPIVDSHGLWQALHGGRVAKTGTAVTLESAMRVTAVLACARVIAEGIAQVPFKLYRGEGRSREAAKDHPLYEVLHRRPNGWMSSFELREVMGYHCVLARGFTAFANRGRGGRVVELIPLLPNTVKVRQNKDWSLTYEVTASNGSVREFSQESIWHVRGPSWNGVVGMDVIGLAREAIGLSIAAEDSQSALHARGARPSGLYSVEGTLSDKQYKDLKKWIDDNYAGDAQAGTTMLLDRMAKFTPIRMSGIDAQHLETRRFQIEEICRALRVMPIMAGYSDKAATYASAEQMFLAHVVHTLSPWYERIEQSADCQLLTEDDRRAGCYAKFAAAGLLRGALKDTAEYLGLLTDRGIMTRNEAREKLELNPLDGLDEPMTPMNMRIGNEEETGR